MFSFSHIYRGITMYLHTKQMDIVFESRLPFSCKSLCGSWNICNFNNLLKDKRNSPPSNNVWKSVSWNPAKYSKRFEHVESIVVFIPIGPVYPKGHASPFFVLSEFWETLCWLVGWFYSCWITLCKHNFNLYKITQNDAAFFFFLHKIHCKVIMIPLPWELRVRI